MVLTIFFISGGVKNFAQQESTYEKWVLNRPFQAKMVDDLRSLAELENMAVNPRKCLREREIKKSEEKVGKIVSIMKEDFINPFADNIDRDRLYNLACGRPLSEEIAEELLSVERGAQEMFKEFGKRLKENSGQDLMLFDPIKRAPWQGFNNAKKTAKVRAKGKTRDVSVQRDILGLLMAKASKENAAIDIDKALSYSLAPVPLSLATSDGLRRITKKSKLFDAAISSTIFEDESIENPTCHILDLIATIRCVVKVPDTFRALAEKLFQELPRNCKIVYVACDTYAAWSIKSAERKLRGQGEEFVIRNPDIRIPPDFKQFLSNGNNKERLFELIEDVWKDKTENLENRVVYFARKSTCMKISAQGIEDVPELYTNHEEADTKISYLAHHALENNNGRVTTCIVRSPSGDIDIPVILLASQSPNLKIYIDNGIGKQRKMLDLSSCELSSHQKEALLGMHAFTGNDYVSCFFRKGKKACWKLLKESQEFLATFSQLGVDNRINEDLVASLEKFVCRLYGEKRLTCINSTRKKIFWRNFSRDERITDLSLLPPCKSSLLLHISRANYVARIWRQASLPLMDVEAAEMHGWKDDLSEEWVTVPYPDDILELLIDIDDDELDERGIDVGEETDFSDEDEDV